MFVFFFFELRTCAAPQFQRASVRFWFKCCRLPQRALPLRVPWALRSRELPSESGEPGLAAGEHSCLRLPWVRDLPPGARTRHRGIGGLRKGGRGGGTRGPGGGVRLGHCARAGAGRWSLARGLQSQLRIVSTSLAANRPQVVGVDSVRCAESLTESRIVFTICS